MSKRMTWGQVKNGVVDDSGSTLGECVCYASDDDLELPKNNRLVISDLDKQKIHDVLVRGHYGSCEYLNIYGDKAPNIYAKAVIDGLVDRLRGAGVNVVETTFTWYDYRECREYNNGDLEWLKSPNFITIGLRSFDLVIEGRKSRGLRHRFTLAPIAWGERCSQGYLYETFLRETCFSDERILDNIHELLNPFVQELQEIYYYPANFDRYCEEHYDINNKNRELICQKIYDDLHDISSRVANACVKIRDDRFDVKKRMSS